MLFKKKEKKEKIKITDEQRSEILKEKFKDVEKDTIGLSLFQNEYCINQEHTTEIVDKSEDESTLKFRTAPVEEKKEENEECTVIYSIIKEAGIYRKNVKILRNIKEKNINLKIDDKEFLIDNGDILGGRKYSILLDMDNDGKKDTAFVPIELKYKDLIIKGLKGEVLTFEEGMEAMKNYLPNLALYTVFDFTDTEKFDEIKADEYKWDKFTHILESIYEDALQKTNSNNISEVPRMRFTELKDFNEFTLVSDENVKCHVKEANTIFCKGMKYVVTPEKWEYFYNDKLFVTAKITYAEKTEVPFRIVNTENFNPYLKFLQQ